MFNHFDTKRSDGVRISFQRVLVDDPTTSPETFDLEMDAARKRAWYSDEWRYVGVVARATVEVVRNGIGTLYSMDSAGTWGVEDDAGDYLDELYREQCEELRGDIEALRSSPVTYAA